MVTWYFHFSISKTRKKIFFEIFNAILSDARTSSVGSCNFTNNKKELEGRRMKSSLLFSSALIVYEKMCWHDFFFFCRISASQHSEGMANFLPRRLPRSTYDGPLSFYVHVAGSSPISVDFLGWNLKCPQL